MINLGGDGDVSQSVVALYQFLRTDEVTAS
jgi:hypothetical protein